MSCTCLMSEDFGAIHNYRLLMRLLVMLFKCVIANRVRRYMISLLYSRKNPRRGIIYRRNSRMVRFKVVMLMEDNAMHEKTVIALNFESW